MAKPLPANASARSFERSHRRTFALVLAALVALLIGLRLVNLEADPPYWYIHGDVGFHIDEGYKTLAAKNMAAFGVPQWNPADDYRGWLKASPVTQWGYYAAYRLGGIKLANARIVSIAWCAVFLILAALFLRRHYSAGTTLAALLVLGLDPAIWHFSRSAIFEMTITAFVYAGFFVLSILPRERLLTSAVILCVAGFIAAYLIKLSALMYVLPAMGILTIMGIWHSSQRRKALYVGAIILGLAVLALALSARYWTYRLSGIDPVQILYEYALNPMPDVSPLALLGAYCVVLVAVLRNPAWLWANPYRTALTATAIATPMLLSLFHYDPPRYYMPAIPACLLLIIEAFAFRRELCRAETPVPLPWWRRIAEALLVILIAMQLPYALNGAFLTVFSIGSDPGLSEPTLMRLLPWVAGASIAGYYILRRWIDQRFIAHTAAILVAMTIFAGAQDVTRSLVSPEYHRLAISQKLSGIVAKNQSVAGDWAPYFTIEPTRRSLYSSLSFNYGNHYNTLRPDYFMYVPLPQDEQNLGQLKADDTVHVGKPIELGEYLGRTVLLYPLAYTRAGKS